jgi:hypothetical protein
MSTVAGANGSHRVPRAGKSERTMTTSSTTTGRRSPLQHWLEFLASTRSGARRDAPAETPTYAAAVRAHKTAGGWDPHEVWLDRIKKPRDERLAAAAVDGLTGPALEAGIKESR